VSTPPREVVRRLVAGTNLDDFSEEVLASFWRRPEFQELHPPRRAVRDWVRWNVDLMLRWLVDGRPPADAELARLRDWGRDRAAEGVPLEVVQGNFRRGARYAWGAMVAVAGDADRPALVEIADLLFDYVDRVSHVLAEAYAEAPASAETLPDEAQARATFDRLAGDRDLTVEDHAFAERIGLQLRDAYRPFVIEAPRLPPRALGALAARLRARGALAVAEGRRVAGIAQARLTWADLGVSDRWILAEGDPTPRAELADALAELRLVVELAEVRGRAGRVTVDEHLCELLLQRSPRIARRIRARVYGRLEGSHPELARTLDVLVGNGFERAATAQALPAHRNTLANRLRRIYQLTGLDVDQPGDRALIWLAWTQRAA